MLSFIKAHEKDILTIQQLAHTIWYNHYTTIISEEQIEYMLNLMYSTKTISKEIQHGYFWYLIMENSQPIGFISFHFENDDTKMKLEKLYTLVSHHGKGYGQESLNFVKDSSKKMDAQILCLRVNKQNTKAINAYIKAGFTIEREDTADIGNGYVMDDYIMSINL